MKKTFTENNILNDMRSFFGDDTRRIKHAEKVLSYAKEILSFGDEDASIVIGAAVLHDIGIHAAEAKYGSPAGNYQEIEGPPIAEKILLEYDLNSDDISHICKIIANHHSAKDIDTPEFRIIWDADWLVNIPEEYDLEDKSKLRKLVNNTFKTEYGKKIAEKIFFN